MRVWRDKYPNVIIPKNHRFTECKTCSHLKAVLKGKPEVFDSDVSVKKKINILQEIVSLSANITIFSISETLVIIFKTQKPYSMILFSRELLKQEHVSQWTNIEVLLLEKESF